MAVEDCDEGLWGGRCSGRCERVELLCCGCAGVMCVVRVQSRYLDTHQSGRQDTRKTSAPVRYVLTSRFHNARDGNDTTSRTATTTSNPDTNPNSACRNNTALRKICGSFNTAPSHLGPNRPGCLLTQPELLCRHARVVLQDSRVRRRRHRQVKEQVLRRHHLLEVAQKSERTNECGEQRTRCESTRNFLGFS